MIVAVTITHNYWKQKLMLSEIKIVFFKYKEYYLRGESSLCYFYKERNDSTNAFVELLNLK